MFKKIPTWTRSRAGRNRVHWVAYDDQPGSPDTQIVDQGYAISLVEADAAARAALAAAGIYQARRSSKGFGSTPRAGQDQPQKPARPAPVERPRPREYLYSRHEDDQDDRPWGAAHWILKKTPRRVYVTRKSCGLDQLGTEDEVWGPNEVTISLDRIRLGHEGSVFTGSYRQSAFFPTPDAALGDASSPSRSAFEDLGLRAPCTVAEIRAAYRSKAFALHPDRGGNPDEFRVVEAAYRRLLREAQAPES